LRELIYLLAVPFVSLTGLAAFEAWWSAAAFAFAIGLIAFFAVRHQEKHHRPEVYDDRLSTERMEAARDWLMKD
jgi:hypothetical protein